jgi:hypothetical protein
VVSNRSEANSPAPAFEIAVDASESTGRYLIRNGDGIALPRIPELPIGKEKEAKRAAQTIRHLSQYEFIKNLRNPGSTMLPRLFTFKVTSGETASMDGTWRVKHDEMITMHIKNKLPKPPSKVRYEQNMNSLWVHYFNLTQDYEVVALHVDEPEVSIVEPQMEMYVTEKMKYPEQSDTNDVVQDVIKVIVSNSMTHFEKFEMGKLEDSIRGEDVLRTAEDEDTVQSIVEDLLGEDQWVGMRPVERAEKVALRDWQAFQTVVLISPPPTEVQDTV